MSLPSRVTTVVTWCVLFCALATAAIGGLGIVGVRSATATEKSLTDDELSTATITAQLGHKLDRSFADGQAVALAASPGVRRRAADTVRNVDVPDVESAMASLLRIHEGDDAAEVADLGRLQAQWVTLRTVLNDSTLATRDPADVASRLQTSYRPLSSHVHGLVSREAVDARLDQRQSSAQIHRLVLIIVLGVLFVATVFGLLGLAAARRLRRAIEPAQEQVEFAETLQLAENEEEAHRLLQRHLKRQVDGSDVTVLSRNNSADRLEAATDLPEGSSLTRTLAHAEPRSCLALRSARVHHEDDQRPGLLACGVCAGSAGASTCSPLTVGGEVIGSVLVQRPARLAPLEHRQVVEAVGQAAPVLANLRNLAIAELRAATDSLTGLPNKRAVADTLKRMIAQAARTLTPLSLLVLDLDHFKQLNDRFGHQVGDQVLAGVGAALRSALRDSDFAGRNGGEEFAVMLPGTDLEGATATADKIRTALADVTIPGLDLAVSASIGIATYPDHAVGPERLERLADSALFVAKRSGRNRVEVASAVDEPAGSGVGEVVGGHLA